MNKKNRNTNEKNDFPKGFHSKRQKAQYNLDSRTGPEFIRRYIAKRKDEIIK
jgi:hypothetical protein